MKILTFPDAAGAADFVSGEIAGALRSHPTMVLGLPTGSTPLRVYDQLARLCGSGALSFSQARIFNLDEYLGLGANHPASYAAYMRRELFDRTDCELGLTHIPDGRTDDPAEQCRAYEDRIKAVGGIDLMLLGLGRNAHIGFNEPGSSHDSRTRVVDLAPATIEANLGHFPPGAVMPTQALSMGIGTIREARRIVVLATGADKAEAVRATRYSPRCLEVPSTALLDHGDVTLVIDAAAAGAYSKQLVPFPARFSHLK